MRKFIILILSACSLHMLASHDFVKSGIYYNYLGGDSVEVTDPDESIQVSQTNYRGDIIIPENVINNGTTYRVTRIGAGAFDWDTLVTSINMPNSITSIGNGACNNCKRLQTVVFSDHLISIGQYAFRECDLLSAELPASLRSLGEGSFSENYNLQTMIFHSMTPPVLEGGYTFWYVPAPFQVPCGTKDDYIEAWGNEIYNRNGWPDESLIFEDFPFNYTITSSSCGQVSINEDDKCSQNKIILTAVPNENYAFHQWSDGNTDNPRSIILSSDTTLEAIFTTKIKSLNELSNHVGEEVSLFPFYVQYTHGKYIWIRDAVGYGIIYATDYALTPGDFVYQGFRGKVQDYYSLIEILPKVSVGKLSINHISTPISFPIAGDEPKDETVNQIVLYKGITINEDFVQGGGAQWVNWKDTTLRLFNKFGLSLSIEAGKTYDILASNGPRYNNEFEIWPLEITEVITETPSVLEAVSENNIKGSAYVSILAVPETGYQFLCWDDFNTENPRMIPADEYRTYTAYFKESTTTQINNVKAVETTSKTIQNGQVLILHDGKTYTTQGVQVN